MDGAIGRQGGKAGKDRAKVNRPSPIWLNFCIQVVFWNSKGQLLSVCQIFAYLLSNGTLNFDGFRSFTDFPEFLSA